MIPMMCLAVGIAIWTIGGRFSGAGKAISWPLVPLLTLIVFVPPAAQAAMGDYELSKVTTEETAARWIQENLPPGKKIVIDDPRIRLPPAFPTVTNTRLVYESLESYAQQGVVYLVTSSMQTDRYFNDPAAHPGEVAGWNRIFASTEMLKVIRAPGQSTITILKIRD